MNTKHPTPPTGEFSRQPDAQALRRQSGDQTQQILQRLFAAADNHAEDTGEEHNVGDLPGPDHIGVATDDHGAASQISRE